MASPLKSKIAKTVHKALKSTFFPAVLTVEVPGVVTEEFDPVPNPTQKTYACRAIVESYSDTLKAQGFVKQGEYKVLILAQSLAIDPAPGHRIAIDGARGTQTFSILAAEVDPAGAVWTCKGAA